MKKKMLYFVIAQILIVALMLLFYKELSLTSFINMSFFVGGTLVFIGLLVYIVSNGFFDIFTMSMRKVFTFRRSLVDVESMRAPSELLDFPTLPFFQVGGSVLGVMFIALFFYYFI
ncbi:DUF3899 domain-containing protein [Paenisporosarcina indica]|uniref:DUF3899 domain-containing protein n=1 Tax=Paenisporosarcina indica TaxID=650093 RepID=UPI00094FD08B|nr:DUF3899 domain-containing protein [Paenisporosarcina indica]